MEFTLPALGELLSDPDAKIRYHTVIALGQLVQKNKQAVPLLVAALSDSNCGPTGKVVYVKETAINLLGQVGPDARTAVPQLNVLLRNTNSYTRREAAIALWRIDGDTNIIPILVSELEQTSDEETCAQLLNIFGCMGRLGKPAIPAICGVVTNRFRMSSLSLIALESPWADRSIVRLQCGSESVPVLLKIPE